MRVLGIYLSILGVGYLVTFWLVMKPALQGSGRALTFTEFNYIAIAYYLAPGTAGLLLYFLAPSLCRLLIPEPLAKLPLEPESRIRNERFVMLLVGCLLTVPAVSWMAGLTWVVEGRLAWTSDPNSWAWVLAHGVTGLLLILKTRAVHDRLTTFPKR